MPTAEEARARETRNAAKRNHSTARQSFAGELKNREAGKARPASSYQERHNDQYSLVNPANLVYLAAGEEERKPIRTPCKIARRAPSV